MFTDIVIGGGSAGISYATTAARLGAQVLLIERAELGGTCVNRGCVPKKLLWDAAWARSKLGAFTTVSDMPPLAFSDLHNGIWSKVSAIQYTYTDSLRDAGVELTKNRATVHADRSVTVGQTRHTAERIIIATGARPTPIDIPGGALAETSDDVLRWQAIPERIAFLGGGYIGCELASIFRAFGSEVTLIDPSDRLLSPFALPLAEAARCVMVARGIDVRLGKTPERITSEAGGLKLNLGDQSLHVDKIVAAIGRTPNVGKLGSISECLSRAKSGALAIDDRFETSLPGVYAIGDAADRLPLTPVATRDGDRLAHMLHGDDRVRAIDLALVASAAFVMPPIAQVGNLETEAQSGNDLVSGALVAENHWTSQTLKLINCSDTTGVQGAGLMAEAAADLVAPFAALLALAKGRKNVDAATGVHPTFGEEVIGR